MYVSPTVDPNPVAAAFVEAGPAVGLPTIEDHNAGEMEGTCFFNMTIKDSKRFSVPGADLRPALSRQNLTVMTHADTRRLLFKNDRRVGVEYAHEGQVKTARASQEVILSAGMLGTPHALLPPGIGPETDLKSPGIDVTLNMPGVGQNSQDHALCAGNQLTYEYMPNGDRSRLRRRSGTESV